MRGQAAGLRPLAPARPRRLGLGRCACRSSSGSTAISSATPSITAPAANGGSSSRACNGTSWMRSIEAAERDGHPRDAGLQHRRQQRRRLFPRQPEARRAHGPSARAFLKPVLNRPNLRLETGVLVEKVLFEGRRAVGVQFRQDGRLVEARTRGEVVLSAGAVGSPQILQLSGVGPADWLGELGIAVVQDTPGVGRNLQDHLQQRAIFKVLGREDAQHDLPFAGRPRADGRGICLVPEGAAHHGALAARHLHHVVVRTRAGQHRVPRPAAVARQVRRAAASLPRHHGQRLQPAPDLARHDPAALGRSRRPSR